MFCSKCGAKNANDTLFCGECGVPIGAAWSGSQNPQQQSPKRRKGKRLLIGLLATVVLIVGVFVYLNTGARLADKQAVQGEKYLAGKQYNEAIGAFEKAIKTDKKTAKAYNGLADAYVGLKNTKKAEETVQSGIEASPEADILYLKLAELYNHDGKPGKAAQTLKTGYAAVKSQNIQTRLKKLQASFINIAGGQRVSLYVKSETEGDIQEVIRILKDRAAQLGYINTVIYSGSGSFFYVDIIGEKLDANQLKDLINIQRPVDLKTLQMRMIPPQFDENNVPDEINIMGGVRWVCSLKNQTVSIEEVIRSLRERAAQLGYDGTAIYQQEKSMVVIDLWKYNNDIDGALDELLKDQVNIDIMEKRQIRQIH